MCRRTSCLADRSMSNQELSALYPELAQGGRLAPTLRGCLRALASELDPKDPLGATYALVEAGSRSCQVTVALAERSFLSDFWHQGVLFGHLRCTDLGSLARAIQSFVEHGCTSADLKTAFPTFALHSDAEPHERGELVDHAWSCYLNSAPTNWPENLLAEVFAAAALNPRLRALMPFTSHSTACFSTTTGYPYSNDCPKLEVLRSGECLVFPPGESHSSAFRGTIPEAVRVAETLLPEGISGARSGTAEDGAA